MAGRTMNMAVVVSVFVFLAAGLLQRTEAAEYVVGDTSGWTIPATNDDSFYDDWADRHTFIVGDVITFNFTTGEHDVAIVTEQAHDDCNTTNPISLITTGPAHITLNTTGKHYYICAFPSHCTRGQKLDLNVTAGTASSPNGTVPTPPPPSGGGATLSLALSISVIFISTTVALLC